MPRSPASNLARAAGATSQSAAPAPADSGWHMVDTTRTRQVVQFYTIEIAQLEAGGFHVAVTATTVDDLEPQLLCQEVASDRVGSIDDALAIIKECVADTD